MKIQEKISSNVSVDEDGCEIWNGYLINSKIPCMHCICENNVKRLITVSRFLWTQFNGIYDYRKEELVKSCGKDRCLNLHHMCLKPKNKSGDHDHVWKLILAKTIEDHKGCFILMTASWNGYNVSMLDGVSLSTHKIVYIIRKNNGNPIPEYDENGEPLVIRHTCNERSCVNPEHLKLGTRSENSNDDRILAGTVLNGCKNPKTSIAEAVARKIKLSKREKGHPEYMTQPARAQAFGVSKAIVSSIDYNTSWAHLPDRDGVVKSNDDFRREIRTKARLARDQTWTDQDFTDAGEKIKKHVVESNEGKSGEMPPEPCWIWQLSNNAQGYGNVSIKHRTGRAHILSCEVKYGRRAHKGEVVRHLCNNPPCCNPCHVVFGSHKDNSRDSLLHGTSKNFKFDPDSVRHVRASKKTNAELAKQYGVHRRAIYNIRTGKTWSAVV